MRSRDCDFSRLAKGLYYAAEQETEEGMQETDPGAGDRECDRLDEEVVYGFAWCKDHGGCLKWISGFSGEEEI